MKIIVCFMCLFLSLDIFAQKKELKNTGLIGTERSIYSLRKIEIDNHNNKYVVGVFKDQIMIKNDTLKTNLEYGYFMAMLDAQDSIIWSKKIIECKKNFLASGSNLNNLELLAGANSLYMSIRFEDTIIVNGFLYLAKGENDILLMKINSFGQILFFNQINSTASLGFGRSPMAIDNNNNLNFIGEFGNSLDSVSTLYYGNDSIKGYNSNGFLLKIDTNGNYNFAKSYGGIYQLGLESVSSYNNELYIVGSTQNISTKIDSVTINFGGFSANHFIVKLDSNGVAKWGKYFKMNTNLGGIIVTDIKVFNDNIFFAGGAINASGNLIANVFFENGGIISGLGNGDYFIASYNINGNFRWAKLSQCVATESISQLAIDNNKNLLAVGSFDNNMYMGNDTLKRKGFDDIFVTSLDSNGNYLWSTSAGGSGVEVGNGIATTTDGEIYVIGGTASSTCYFGQDTVQVDSLPSMFLAKIKNATPVGLLNPPKDDFWNVFPNPASEEIVVKSKLQSVSNTSIYLYNALGQQIYFSNYFKSTNEYKINVSVLPKGIYYLHLKQNGKTNIKKINIIH